MRLTKFGYIPSFPEIMFRDQMADPTSERVPAPENFTDDDIAEVLFNVSVKPPRAIVSEVFAPRPATVVGDEVNVTVRLVPLTKPLNTSAPPAVVPTKI